MFPELKPPAIMLTDFPSGAEENAKQFIVSSQSFVAISSAFTVCKSNLLPIPRKQTTFK